MPHIRINSKWIKDLNIKPKTIRILEENIVKYWLFLVTVFCLMHLLRRETNEKLNKWDYIKQKIFLHSKGNHEQNKNTTHRMGEHIHQYI